MLPSRIFFDNFFDDFDSIKESDDIMKCDIYEINDNYVIELDIPGYKKEDIKMEIDSGYLIISAKHQNKEGNKARKYIRRERKVYETLMRKFYVGEIKDEDVKATLTDGVLVITVKNKQKEEPLTRVITID